MKREFPEFQLQYIEETKRLRWKGKLSIRMNDFLIEIEYPDSYPFIQPKVFVSSKVNGEYKPETFTNSVHVMPDNSLCLFTWDEGEHSWQYTYPAIEAIYRLIEFIDMFQSDSVPSEHYSLGFTEINRLNRGIIFPVADIPDIKVLDQGTIGLIPLNRLNNRTLIVNVMRIKSQSQGTNILSFNIGFPLPIDFFNLKWFFIPLDTFNRLNRCSESQEFNNILSREYPEWEEEGFKKPIVFLTKQNPSKSTNKVQWFAFGVTKHPMKPLLLGKIQVRFGIWDDLFFDRQTDMLGEDCEIIKNSLICLIGVGSLGSEIAVQLAMTGFTNFFLVDPDILVPENLTRHSLDIRYLHEYKVLGLKHLLTCRNPQIKVEVLINSILEPQVPYLIVNKIKKTGKKPIIVCTTSNLEVEYLLNSISLEQNIPVVYSYCNSKVEMGRILRVVPPHTPCFHCFATACKKNEIITFPKDEETSLQTPYQLGLPGVGLDIIEIAASTSRMILQTILETEEGTSIYPKIRWDNILQVIHPVNGMTPGIYPANVIKKPQCEFCGKIETKSEDLNVVQELIDELKKGSRNEKDS